MKVSVLGAGSWGTALACLLAGKGTATTLWARDEAKALSMDKARENATYLPGVRFPDSLTVASNLEEAARAPSLILAVPARAQREIVRACVLGPAEAFLCAAKGYEPQTRQRMSEVLREELGITRGVAVLAGPQPCRRNRARNSDDGGGRFSLGRGRALLPRLAHDADVSRIHE